MKMNTFTHTVEQISEQTRDSYTRDLWKNQDWNKVIAFLLDEGLSETQINWILMSKHMRWSDAFNENNPSLVFAKYYTSNQNNIKRDILGK